ANTRVLDSRARDRNSLDDADRDRGTLHLGLSGHLHSLLVQQTIAQTRSVTALAVAFFPGLYRHARRRLSRRCTRDPLHGPRWPAVSPPRSDPVRHFRRHHHYLDRPGIDVALRGALARAQPPG